MTKIPVPIKFVSLSQANMYRNVSVRPRFKVTLQINMRHVPSSLGHFQTSKV